MSRALYEIDQDILNCVDPETGEVDAEKIDSLMGERNDKLEGVALWVKNLTAEADALKAEEKALAERRKAKENKVESLKRWLYTALNGEHFETAKCDVKFRNSQKVIVTDYTKIPDDYLRFKEPEPDKSAIKKAIKDGIEIGGVELIDSISMSIK